MLVIRLRRIGKKKKPSYRIVVAEHTMPVSGKFVEDLGFYNPHTKAVGLAKDKVLEWLGKGAKPSNTVAKVLTGQEIRHKSISVIRKNKKSKAKSEKTADTKPAAIPADEAVIEVAETAPNETADQALETDAD